MEISFTFRHSDTSEALKQHVAEKLDRLSKYFLKAVQAHVILNVEHGRHIAEITLSEKHRLLYAKDASHDMYHSVDGVLDKLEHQLKKVKERAKEHHVRY